MWNRNRSSFRASLRVGVGEERDDVHLGVPEVVTVVAAGAESLRGDALLVGAGTCLSHLEQVPSDRLLCLGVAVDLDVAALPEGVEPGTLLLVERAHARARARSIVR
jgi:hypothetical protein